MKTARSAPAVIAPIKFQATFGCGVMTDRKA
jgi:hypothetical protein